MVIAEIQNVNTKWIFWREKSLKKKKVKTYLAIDLIDCAFTKRYTALQCGDSSPHLKALSSEKWEFGNSER